MPRRTAILLQSLILLGVVAHRGRAQERIVRDFDFGPLVTDTASTAVGTTTDYGDGRNYGWIRRPNTEFARPKLARSREAELQDGVLGSDMVFQADVPSGKWWMTLYLDAGMEDSSTVQIAVNGVGLEPDWQSFDPPAEGRTELQRIYRVLHRPVYIHDEGLRVHLTAGQDSVRLLAMSLHADPIPSSSTDTTFVRRLEKLGTWNALLYDPARDTMSVFETIWSATNSLAVLRARLAAQVTLDPGDSFASYWIEQLDILIKAERYFAMRGWEWAKKDTGLGLFDRLTQTVMLLDGLLDRPDIATYPLRERALFTRGRLLYWLAEERGGREERAKSQVDLAWLLEQHPDQPLLRMYNGQRVETPDGCIETHADSAASPPGWSLAQKEALCHMRAIAAWWTNVQQADNGEFGGKLGDDVELLRWWPPLILSGDTLAMSGWRRLADGVWHSDQISDGYADEVSDVEHSSEFISDTAPFMALAEDNPAYVDRLRPSYRHFRNLWSGITDKGHRFFRSAWFSSSKIETDPPKNRDVGYNARATKAVRYLAWKTRDLDVIETLYEWSKGWASAALRTDKGKPKGIIPASVRFPDEAINGDEPNWYQANMYWDYFDWTHSAGAKILDQLLFTFTLNSDVALLEPMFLSLDLVRAYAMNGMPAQEPAVGSRAWTAARLMRESMFWSVASQWRIFTGDQRYDDLLKEFGTPYVRFRLTGDPAVLESVLRNLNENLRVNRPLRTYEAIHTDRVYLDESQWPPEFEVQAMLTGDGMQEGLSPYHAVTWPDGGPDFTALVTDTGPDRLSAIIYSYDNQPRTVTARVWQLDAGTYRVSSSARGQAAQRDIDIDQEGQRVSINLPPHESVTVSFKRLAN